MLGRFFTRATPTESGKKGSAERAATTVIDKDDGKKKKDDGKKKKKKEDVDDDVALPETPFHGGGGFAAMMPGLPSAALPNRPLPVEAPSAAPPAAAAAAVTRWVGPLSATMVAAIGGGCPRSLPMVPGPQIFKCDKALDVAQYPCEWYAVKCLEYFTDAAAVAARERGYVKFLMKHCERMWLVLREDSEPVLVFHKLRALMPHGKAATRVTVVEHVSANMQQEIAVEEGPNAAPVSTWRVQIPRSAAQRAVKAGLLTQEVLDDSAQVINTAGHDIVQVDTTTTEDELTRMCAMACDGSSSIKLCARIPYAAVTTSVYAETQFSVRQRFIKGKARADSALSAYKLASYLTSEGCYAYSGGSDVHVMVDEADEKAKVKAKLSAHAVWKDFLPDDTHPFVDDAQTAWASEKKPPPPPALETVDTVAKTYVLAEGEEFVVVRAREPLPKNAAVLINAIPGLVYVATRTARLAFAKAKIDEGRTNARYIINGRVLFTQRAKEWTADNV